MKTIALLITTVALALPTASLAQQEASDTLTAASATRIFRDYLASKYGTAFTKAKVSYSKCANLESNEGRADCVPEFGTGRTWRLRSVFIATDGKVDGKPFVRKWKRKMRKQSASCLRSWGVKGTLYSNQGVCSAALAFHYFRGQTFTGGTGSGSFLKLNRYPCKVAGRTVRCKNALGDAIRWVRPK
jgi:hypothetical protein